MAPLPHHPTHAAPGTTAKVEVMARRAERGEQLHHPDDCKPGFAEGLEVVSVHRRPCVLGLRLLQGCPPPAALRETAECEQAGA